MSGRRKDYLKYFIIPVCVVNTIIIALCIIFTIFIFDTKRQIVFNFR